MIDLQIVKTRQVITPSNISVVPGVTPAVLDIRGSNLDKVTEVRINDTISPSVMVVSSHQVLAQVPNNITNTVLIRMVEMLTSLPVTTDPAKLFFEVGRTPVPVQGIQKLVQLVIKILLTTPGRDIIDPGLGGGFLQQVGRTISTNNVSALMTDLSVGISRTQTQIVESQTSEPSIPDDERLLSLDLADALFDPESSSIFVALRVESAAGDAAVAKLFI